MTALLLGRGAVVHAADPVEDTRVRQAEALLERLATLQAAGKRDALERGLGQIPKLHNELRTKSMRAKLQKALGRVLKDESLKATRSVAADVLGQLNDPKGAAKELKPFLPTDRDKTVGPFPLRVIQATGVLASDASIPSLVKLMEKARDPNVSRYAIQALGKYGWSKKRVSVLSDLLDFLKKLKPGVVDPRLGRVSGQAANERYQFLQASLVAAMNELTGQGFDSPEAWAAAAKAQKKSLGKLFTFER